MRKSKTAETKKNSSSSKNNVKKKPGFNRAWFDQQLSARGLSQGKLAKTLGVDRSAISILFAGKRRLKLDEAPKVAEVLGVSIDDVLVNSGVSMASSTESPRTIALEGWVDSNWVVRWETPPAPKSVPCPFAEKDVKAVRIQSAGSKFAGLDRWVVYFRPAFRFNPESVGELCIVRIVGDKESKLRAVQKGYVSGHYNLTTLNGEVIEENVPLESSAPIIFMKRG